MTETVSEIERPSTRPPGLADHQCRTAIRDLIEEYGELKAALMLSWMLEDERMRAKR